MGLLDGLPDPHQGLPGEQRRRQVLGVGTPGPVDPVANEHAQPGRGEARSEAVYRHNPPGMQESGAIVPLELGIVEDDRPAAVLDPATDHDAIALGQPAFDEATPEPDRLRLAGFVVENGHGPLHPSAERLLDSQLPDADPRAGDLAIAGVPEGRQRAHLAEIVVAAWKVEQQVADGPDAEARKLAAQGRCTRQAAPADRQREEGGIWFRGRRGVAPRFAPGRSPGRGANHRYSTEIR